MANWLTEAAANGLELSVEDLFAIAIWRRLRADALLTSVFKEGRILRKHVYAAELSGGKPRLVVGVILNRESLGLSRLIKGQVRIGVLVEFEAFQEQLADTEPSVQSLLSYVRNVAQFGPPHVPGRGIYQLQDPRDPAAALNTQWPGKDADAWEPIPGIPNDLEKPTAWGIGMEAVIPYKAEALTRQPWTGGPVA